MIGGAFLLVALGGTPSGHAPWFRVPTVYSGLSGALAAGDFNNDGKPDLAVANLNSVSIVLGNGDGSFQPPVSYTVLLNLKFFARRDDSRRHGPQADLAAAGWCGRSSEC